MTHGHTKETLVAFRDRVARAFADKRIRSPVHFPGGEEEHLIAALADMRPEDWLCLGWRSMYAALLKGCPEEWVFGEILAGRSMYLMSREHRVLSSSIVGGILPVACGLAMGARRRGGSERVYVVVGDMTATTGLYHEFVRYCTGHALPVRIVICDNGLSTNADTKATWGTQCEPPAITRFHYRRTMPHVVLLQRVNF